MNISRGFFLASVFYLFNYLFHIFLAPTIELSTDIIVIKKVVHLEPGLDWKLFGNIIKSPYTFYYICIFF